MSLFLRCTDILKEVYYTLITRGLKASHSQRTDVGVVCCRFWTLVRVTDLRDRFTSPFPMVFCLSFLVSCHPFSPYFKILERNLGDLCGCARSYQVRSRQCGNLAEINFVWFCSKIWQLVTTTLLVVCVRNYCYWRNQSSLMDRQNYGCKEDKDIFR